MTVTLDVDGLGPTLFCHATPRRDDEFVLVDSPIAPERRARRGRGARRRLRHTHMPRPGRRPTRSQPGSVGMAYGPWEASGRTGPQVELVQDGPRRVRGSADRGERTSAREVAREYGGTTGRRRGTEVFTTLVGTPPTQLPETPSTLNQSTPKSITHKPNARTSPQVSAPK
jgi:hypothetical protein